MSESASRVYWAFAAASPKEAAIVGGRADDGEVGGARITSRAVVVLAITNESS